MLWVIYLEDILILQFHLDFGFSGRFEGKSLVPYIASQCAGAIAAAGVLYMIYSGASGFDGFSGPGAFASNFYGEAVYNGKSFSMMAAFTADLS